jgi:hypothetical protein
MGLAQNEIGEIGAPKRPAPSRIAPDIVLGKGDQARMRTTLHGGALRIGGMEGSAELGVPIDR